jgi:acetyl-CoA C-acetyltransferase
VPQAVNKALDLAGLTLEQMDLIEIQEAFAAQARVLVTLLHEMRRRNVRYGLECICGGGGLGSAAVFERK